MMSRLCCLFVLFLILLGLEANAEQTHTDVVLVGALGDLSKKYLWQSIFELYLKYNNENNTFRFYGCGLKNVEIGQDALTESLTSRISCANADEICNKQKTIFVKQVRYFPVKTKENLETLSSELNNLQLNGTETRKKGRIFYLALPPSVYVTTAENLHKCCYHRDKNSWTRIVLEKPFGSDKDSAKQLAEDLSKFYKEDEIYRVDHYLAKSVVKQILPFRDANRNQLEKLLHHHHVDRMEIVMKETIGVKGRIDYYDQYGVFRDVMQNHLTELLVLVTMDLPLNINNHNLVEENRLRLLQRVKSPKRNSILTGQYSKFMDHAAAEKDNVTLSKFTPTFGATYLTIDSPRWQNVPFILVAGKHLDERSSFIRIVFKDREICMSSCNRKSNNTHFMGPKQIIFQIGHGNLPSAGILISKSLINPIWPNSITELAITAEDFSDYGQNLNDFSFGIPVKNVDAYSTVVEDLYNGRQNSFVGTKRLLKLWDIWSPVLKEIQYEIPLIYKEDKNPFLNFRIANGELEFVSKSEIVNIVFQDDKYSATVGTNIPGTFLGNKLISQPKQELFLAAAHEFKTLSLSSIEERNVFHVAFSGGKTPYDFLKLLVDLELPWEWIHIWQVDERCVPQTDSQSNFYMLQKELLNMIRIPYTNIHPMPVDIAGRICEDSDRGSKLYSDILNHMLPHAKFDLIILGLGLDGHTASLFADTKDLLHNQNDLVSIASSNKITPSKRMTLLFPVINKAREIFVIVAGKIKHDILMNIQNKHRTVHDYPILGVNVTDGHLTWYIDQEALFLH